MTSAKKTAVLVHVEPEEELAVEGQKDGRR
jgi:hypothetical protein